ncbi:MAG: nitroreductase family protein [Desulfobulbaceae bacterium]|nr:nitroreductase family protein [Desulfobulbaceae bacterium]HIJ78128.1 nitroreductase family protein [Deltaproteobacteria bacterium]
METMAAIERRRAVKDFDAKHRLRDDEVEQLMRMALLAPTAFNLQNWRFVLLRDPGQRQAVRKAAWDQAQVTDASLLIVLCANLKSWEQQPARYWRNAPKEVGDFIVPAIDAYYRGKDQVQRDEAMRSCGIAAQTLMLAATAMGYQSCPMDGFDFAEVAKLINLPSDHVIAMFVAIGKGLKPAWPRGGQLTMDEVVVVDRFT